MPARLDNLNEIRDVAQRVLRRASVDERLPTPVDELVSAAGLSEDDDYLLTESKLALAPKELRRLLRSAGRKVRGALDRRERILHVNPSIEVPAQREFVRCHETMHDALPWQRDLLVLGDTARTLAPEIEFRFEQEANQGAAELLFQLDFLNRIARDYRTEIATPVALAAMFGASIHATFRRWIEGHAGSVCGIVLTPEPVSVAPLVFDRHELVMSVDWGSQFSSSLFPKRLTSSSHPFLSKLSPPWPQDLDIEWQLLDIDGDMSRVRIQSFCNTYRTFVLLWVPRRESFIARHRAPIRIAG